MLVMISEGLFLDSVVSKYFGLDGGDWRRFR